MPRRPKYIFADEPRRGHGFLIGLLVVILLLFAVIFTVNFAQNHTVAYSTEYVTLPNLPSPLENWTILHLSDLNGISIGEQQSAIRNVIGTKSYSCVVLSGNMVGPRGDVQPVLDLVNALPSSTPVLLLPGDDDPSLYMTTASSSLSPYAEWAQQLQAAGVTILDEPVSFQRERSTIWFIPVYLYELDLDNTLEGYQNQLNGLNAKVEPLTADEAAVKRNAEFQIERISRIRETLGTIKATDIQVAVSHMPLTKEYVVQAKASIPEKTVLSMHHVSLVLAGGYCAGQWRIPGGGAIWAPEMGFFPEDTLITGMSYLSGVRQHISPGLGASSLYPLLPFRLFNSPAVTRLVLTTRVH